MPITLITGPANAGKAREVLGAVRGHLAHGEEPLLVVPTHADVDRYRRELALEGAVLGVGVERFEGLIGEVERRAGASEPVLGKVARQRVLAAIAARGADRGRGSAALRPPARTGAGLLNRAPGSSSGAPEPSGGRAWSTPGFVSALAAMVAELEVQRVTPARLEAALKAWASADGVGATAGTEELGRLYGEYRTLLQRIGRTDPERRAAQALDALRLEPASWAGTPVLIYGFDDFSALQIDAIETLGAVVDAKVTVSLTYEPGRTAFASRAGTFETLRPLAAEHRRLPARAEYYAPGARVALHHLERSLFESEAARADQAGAIGTGMSGTGTGGMSAVGASVSGAARKDAAGAVRLLEGGGERAELELVAGEVRALLDGGMQADEIAVVHRTPSAVAELLGEVFAAQGVPYALERRICFANTAIGGALIGALRCATDAGELGDLLAWLRAPGLLVHPGLADRLEARARREGVTSAARARSIWEAEHWRLETLEHLREAAQRGGRVLCERAARELEWLFNAPRRGTATLLESDELDEARALAAGRRALAELAGLAHGAPELGVDVAQLASLLEGLELVSGERAGEGNVAVVGPLALRARRVRALFVCGLQEGVFPASARPEPLLAEEERRRLAEASGLRLRGSRVRDALAAERYALYAAVSRPEELLVLSWHAADDDGVAEARSLFVDDIVDLFDEGLVQRRLRRPLGAVGWPGSVDAMPSALGDPLRESACQAASDPMTIAAPGNSASLREDHVPRVRVSTQLQPLRDEELRQELREHVWSASSLEVWAQCPVKWFVQRMLRAEDLDPSPEPLARGGLAHAALKDTFEQLRERTGSARLTAARLELAKELLRQTLRMREAEFPLSAAPERRPGLRRRLEADLERYLEHAAAHESPLEPAYLELGFGFGEDAQDADPNPSTDSAPSVPASPPLPASALPESVPPESALPAFAPAVSVPAAPVLPALDLGEGLRLRGRIDRVDVAAGGAQAVVYDYKGRLAPAAAKWTEQGNVQVALYMRAVEDLLELEAAGGFYQPLSGGDLRARGVLDGESGVEIDCVRGEIREHAEVRQLLDEAVATARAAAAQAGRGELEPRPRTCAYRGGCMYPTICRCES